MDPAFNFVFGRHLGPNFDVLRFSGFLLPGLTNDDEPIKTRFAGFLTEWKVLSAALMKNGL